MSRRKKRLNQHSRVAPALHEQRARKPRQHRNLGAVQLIHLLPSPDRLSEHPLTAHYRVTVLLRGFWSSLHEMLRRQAGPGTKSEEMQALDTLVEVAAPTLAQQALQRHLLEHERVYRQFGLQAFSFRSLPATEPHDQTIWGELTPGDVVPELGVALATATQARATLPDVPANIFWPLVGAFFSAVDNSPHVAAQTWESIVADPAQYTLIRLLAIVSYGKVVGVQYDNELPATDHDSAWQYCQRCGRASQKDECILWENRRLCPYWCNGQVGWDTEDWEIMRLINPSLPIVPHKWVIYPLDDLEPDVEHEGAWL